tara:strand:+ start:3979 stop:7323 length:3345 start_codon:yes stop_codon:yes gene_type:complete
MPAQEEMFGCEPTYRLQQLEIFNWGGFGGPHSAEIDAEGTAIVGPTGSGKTTLVDALMTLLTANPKYNLASTGGHESDRDLVSYVRGVSGPGDGGAGQAHIARSGKTVTGICAILSNGQDVARLGALLWFDDISSTPSDLKKLWFFTTAAEQTLQYWLEVHQEGGMRALRKLEKTTTGLWNYPAKKGYLARVRDFFEVRENAFNLLNRAAGLKQLNSIDDIFRELVLDDSSQFERALEVADSFDDLTAIHEELEVARRQQRSLEPVKAHWEKYQLIDGQLMEQRQLADILPIWFGEQAYQLWKAECVRLVTEVQSAEAGCVDAEESVQAQQRSCDALREQYLQLGGHNIRNLEELIHEKQNNLDRCDQNARHYQRMSRNLGLDDSLSRAALTDNQRVIAEGLEVLGHTLEQANEASFQLGAAGQAIRSNIRQLEAEITAIQQRPGSNIPAKFHTFRALLADELGLQEDELPFVAELVQIKEQERDWRGAIERAIGSHRLRILVLPEQVAAALRWVNQRNNQLHVRILEVKQPSQTVRFMDDGFTQKLDYKPHPYREAVKHLLAGLDLHCVNSPDDLRHTEHAITKQGLTSGKARFFDKQDQKRLDQDWQTGFDNQDRLNSVQQQRQQAQVTLKQQAADVERAKATVAELTHRQMLSQQLLDIQFDLMNTEQAQRELSHVQEQLVRLTAPDSDVTAAKTAYELANQQLKQLDDERILRNRQSEGWQQQLKNAETQKSRVWRRAEAGLLESQRQLAASRFADIAAAFSLARLAELDELEHTAAKALQQQLDTLAKQHANVVNELTRAMVKAKTEDRGALAETGSELIDVPDYLQRLQLLTEEALPEKQNRFKEYLNRSSDDGVTQLLMSVEAEVERIEDKLEEVNSTLRRVDFQAGRYLQLVAGKVVHESLKTFNRAIATLRSARFVEDDGESQYKALRGIIALLRDACERQRTQPAKALLDPRFRLEFKVSVIDRATGSVMETRSGSQGGSGGEKEIIASYVLTASLSYALCPDGSNRPLFGTIVLDEAFSRSSHVVAGRIIAALTEFGLHALFITPNKEMRLLRNHTRSAIVVHRRGMASTLTALTWQELDIVYQQRSVQRIRQPEDANDETSS